MPDFRLHLPRFLRPHRSSRSDSTSANPRNDAADPRSQNLNPTPAARPHPSSSQGALEQDACTATTTYYMPASSSLSTDRLGVDRAPEDTGVRSSPIPPPVTPANVVNSTLVPKLSPPGSVVQPPVCPPHLLYCTDTARTLETPPQQSLAIQRQTPASAEDLRPSQHQSLEVFKNARDFSVVGSSFIDHKNITNINTSNQFMKDLLKETILGAAADSSARDPPPRCHPGTRLAILERCIYFVGHCEGSRKMHWVVGAAGVGKSAIMQSVTESPKLIVDYHASVFLSINGRNDGRKTIITLSYQFAAKSQPYRRAIEDEISCDPSLLQSSMAVQFEKFIVKPFALDPGITRTGRVLIIVDGLDECKETRSQVELLRLISGFCISYPSSPIVWLIASRPEPHIVSFFAKPEVTPAYEKEEIAVDTNEARADVERFLRHELKEIGRESDSLEPSWPDEQHLWKLANAAGGLFAYAQTVVRYIGDSNFGDPASQLSDVLNVIDELPMSELSREEHPMALLDALYARILSNVPPKIMANTRKILLLLSSEWCSALRSGGNFIVLCNWLGMSADEAYAALSRLRSVLHFPQRHEAHKESPKSFHKSFFDYLSRSGFSPHIKLEARQLMVQCAFRVLKDAPDGIDLDSGDYDFVYGRLARHTGARGNISISWPAHGTMSIWDDSKTRLNLYQLAIGEVAAGIERGDPVFLSESYIKLLTTAFAIRYDGDLFNQMRDVVFDKPRRHDFMKHGILKQTPAKAVNFSNFDSSCDVEMQFQRFDPATTLDVWEPSCKHTRAGQYEQGQQQSWTTAFGYFNCRFCYDRLKHQFESQAARLPDQAVTIMFTSSYYCCIEFMFDDPEDEASEWRYRFWLYLSPDERRALGSTV